MLPVNSIPDSINNDVEKGLDLNFQLIIDKLQVNIAVLKFENNRFTEINNFKYLFCNKSYIKYLKLNNTEYVNKYFNEVHLEAEYFWSLYFNEVLTSKNPVSCSAYSNLFGNHAQLLIQPFDNDKIILTLTDLSKFKKLEFRSRERQNKIKSIFNAAPVGFGTVVNRCIVEVNYKLCKIIGYNKGELIGQNTRFLYSNQKDYDQINCEIKKFNKNEVCEFEMKWVKKDGQLIDVLLCLSPFSSNELSDIIVFAIYDITRRKTAEQNLIENKRKLKITIKKYINANNNLIQSNSELNKLNTELKKAQKKAEENNRLKTAFLQNISHEIRTPMNAIMGFSQLIERNLDSPKAQKKYIEIVIYYGSQLLEKLDEIIEISLIETNQIKLNLTVINLNLLFDELLINLNQKAGLLNKKKVNISISYLPDRIEKIISDYSKILHIFIQLTNNALKYCHEGKVQFGYHSTDNDFIVLHVSDTGIGIPDNEQFNIFDQFRQVEVLEETREGLGIGLSIVHGLITLLGGKVWVESEPGKGASFYFSLPLQKCN
jgi:PAS domain S-box-containing protein